MLQKQLQGLYSYITGMLIWVAIAAPALAQPYYFEAEVFERGQTEAVGSLIFQECRISATKGSQHSVTQCGYLKAPLDPLRPDGPSVDLFVNRIKSTGKDIRTDPLLLLAGGPGQAGAEAFINSHSFKDVLKNRHIYVLDQRGTELSTKLSCPEVDALSVNSDTTELTKATAACLKRLEHDPRFFTTSAAAHDIETLRKALNVPVWNIYGVSYGSRLAQQYTKQFPKAVRSLILDGVVPLDAPLGPTLPLSSQSALETVLARCNKNPKCADAFSSVRDTETIFKLFRGEGTNALTQPELAAVVRYRLYSPGLATTLPLALNMAATGDDTLLRNQWKIVETRMKGSVSVGVQNSVLCTEDAPLIDWDRLNWDEIKATFVGERGLLQLREVCKIWPKGMLAADFHRPLSGAVPALLLAGSADPVTPPEDAKRVAATLSHAQLIILTDQGHNLISVGCVPELIAKFVESPQKTLDKKCLDRIKLPHFFLSENGPAL